MCNECWERFVQEAREMAEAQGGLGAGAGAGAGTNNAGTTYRTSQK